MGGRARRGLLPDLHRRARRGAALSALRDACGRGPARPGQPAGVRARHPHRHGDAGERAPRRRREVAADGRAGQRRGGRLVGQRAEAGRVRRHRDPRPRRAAGLSVGARRPGRDPLGRCAVGPAHRGCRRCDPGGAGRRQDPGRHHRPGGREPGALRRHHAHAQPGGRPLRPGRGDGQQEPEGDGRARLPAAGPGRQEPDEPGRQMAHRAAIAPAWAGPWQTARRAR